MAKQIINRRSSKFLLTILFSCPFFARTNMPTIFAFLFPYVDGNDRLYEDTEEGFRRKLDDISYGRIGGQIQNAASQGISSRNLYEPCITFLYYYERLNLFKTYLREQYDSNVSDWDEEDLNIESENIHDTLSMALSMKELYYARNREIFEADKKILLTHLGRHGNQYVLAELLYYISSKNHELPDAEKEIRRRIQGELSRRLAASPNVLVQTREELDDDYAEMRVRLFRMKGFQLMSFTGNAFFDWNRSGGIPSFFPLLEERLRTGTEFTLEVILADPLSEANADTARYRSAPHHMYLPKAQMSRNSIEGLKKLFSVAPDRVHMKTTKLFLPYSLAVFRFHNPVLDYARVDIYSPYIPGNGKRPALVIFKRTNPALFEHFESVFWSIWNDEEVSGFI